MKSKAKRNSLKRLITWMLTVAMLLHSAPLTVLADDAVIEDAPSVEDIVVEEVTAAGIVANGQCGDDITWTLYDDGLLELTGTGAMWNYTEGENFLTWEQIEKVESISISEGITSIGSYAFCYYYCLAGELNIPNSVTSIGERAFGSCDYLVGDLLIPDSVSSIGEYAFYAVSSMTGTLTISEKLVNIPAYAFMYGGFSGRIEIPKGIQSIGEKAFANCDSLEEIMFLADVPPTLGVGCFDEMASLKAVYVPVESYDAYVKALDGIVEEDCIVAVESEGTEPSIIASGKCGDNAAWTLYEDGLLELTGTGEVIYNYTQPNTYKHFLTSEQKKQVRRVTIADGITSLSESLFYNDSGEFNSLSGDLIIPDSVTSIGDMAFHKCTGLNGKLVLSENLTSIGKYAFYDCSGLTGDLVLPDRITTIAENTFYGCKGFNGTLTLPANLTTIESAAFYGCENLTGKLVIPDGVTTIGGIAFYGCKSFTGDLVIPDSVTSIGAVAFGLCSGFDGKLILSRNMTSIAEKTFTVCSGLTGDVLIPAVMTSVGNNAFYNCASLTSVTFKRLEPPTFGTNVFLSASGLETVNVPDEAYDAYVTALNGLISSDKIVAYNTAVTASPVSGSTIKDGLLNVTLTYPPYADGKKLTVTAVDTDGTPYELAVDTMYAAENGMEYVLDVSELPAGEYTFTFTLSDDLVLDGVVYDIANYAKIENLYVDDFYSGNLLLYWNKTGYENEGVWVSAEMQNSDGSWTSIADEEYTSNYIDIDLPSEYYTNLVVRVKIYLADAGTVLAMSDPLTVVADGFTYTVKNGNAAITGYKGSSSSVVIPETIGGYPVTAVSCDFEDVWDGAISLTVPASVLSIKLPSVGSHNCYRSFKVAEENPNYSSDSYGVLYNKAKTQILCFPEYACSNSEYVVPETVTAIPEDCFNRTDVGSVVIHAGVTSIGTDAFQHADELTKITVAEDNAVYSSDEYGVLFNKDKTELIRCPRNISTKEYTVPDSVKTIAYHAFYYCIYMTAIHLPEGLVTIGNDAFVTCYNVTEMQIPSTVKTIGDTAFWSWNDLTSFVVKSKDVVFGTEVFRNCDIVTIHGYTGSTAEAYANANNIPFAVLEESVDDTAAPEIVGIWPEVSGTIGVNTEISVQVMDDIEVDTLTLNWECGGQSGTYTMSVHAVTDFVTIPQDVIPLDGADSVELTITCTDLGGNVSEPLNAEYKVDTVPPEAVSLSATETFDGITLTWTQVNTDDLAGYRIYRKAGDTVRQIKAFAPADGTAYTYTITDRSISYDAAYTYYVVTEDECGNTASSREVTVSRSSYEDILEEFDTVNPTACMILYRFGYVNESLIFDGRDSYDNGKIASYHWEFGDGTVAEGVSVQKSFAESGMYDITLTVVDEAGNTGTTTATITIKANRTDDGGDSETGGDSDEESPDTGDLIITVLDSEGSRVSGAKVRFNLRSDDVQTFYTGSDGTVRIRDVGGAYEVGAFKSGYTPNTAQTEIVNGQETTLEIRMVKSEMISGTFEAERMTLDEIKAAGINPNDPDNQFVYKFEIELEYSLTPPVENGGGAAGDGGIVPGNKNPSGGGSYKKKLIFDPYYATDDADSVGEKREPTYIDAPETNETIIIMPPKFTPTEEGKAPVPVVSVIRLPGEATWLKDFFEVSMEIVNLAPADSGIVLENCVAELSVPGGLTLMDTDKTSADAVYRMDDIRAGCSERATWILRGDQAGSYHLSADFSGELLDFEETITASFKTKNPIRVRAGDNLYMDIIVEDTVEVNHDSAIKIGLRNEDEEPYYLPNISLEGAVHEKTYKTSGNERTKSNLDTLNPGEEIWFEYTVKREDYPAVFENEESRYYLVNQVAKYVDGVILHTTFRTVPPNTISGDRVEVYVVDPETGEESSVTYIDLDFDNSIMGRMPNLVIRTYRLNDEDEYEPCAMNFTFNDTLREAEEGKGKGKITGTTNSDGRYTISGYHITQLANEKKYTITVESSRAPKIEIPLTVLRSGGVGNLEVTVFEIDEDKRLAVPDAEVTIGDTTVKTNQNGVAEFEKVENGKHPITIKSDDYHPYEGTVTVKDETKITQQLKKKEPGSYVYDIRMSLNSNGSTVMIPYGLATGTITFTLQKQIEEGEEFKQYVCQIRNGDTVLKTASFTEDTFTMNIQEMKAGDIIEFAVETNLGAGKYMQADLQVVPSLSLLAKINAPNITFLNGSKTKISIGSKQFESLLDFIDQCDGSLIGNYSGLDEVDRDASQKVDDFTSNVKDTSVKGKPQEFLTVGAEIDYAKGEITISVTAKEEDTFEFKIDGEKMKFNREADKATAVSGDIIFRYNSTKASWEWTVGISGGKEWTVPLVKPKILAGSLLALMFSADLEWGVNTEIKMPSITIGNSGTVSDMQNGIQSSVGSNEGKLVIGANGGVRIDLYEQLVTKGFQSAGIYLKTLIETNYTFPRSMGLGLKFELGWQSKFLFLFGNSGKIAEWEPITAYAALRRTLSDPSTTYNIVTAPESVQWYNTPVDNVLQSEVFSGAQQQIVTLNNGTKLMVYADTDQSFDTDNPVKLKYSVNTDGTWSEPEVVCTDATVDLEPSLTVVGDRAVLVWTDMGQELAGVSTMTTSEIRELYNAMEIRMAEFNGTSWSEPVAVTENETAGLVHEPVAVSDGNTTMIAWLANENGTESADAENPDTIRYALVAEDGTISNGEIAAAYTTASNLVLTAANGTYVLTCTAKNAAGKSTAYKISYNADEALWNEAEQVSAVKSETVALTADENGIIYYIMDGRLYRAGDPNTVLTVSDTLDKAEELSVLNHGGKTYFAWVGAADEGIGLYLCHMDESGVVSEPVPIVTGKTEHYDTPVLAPDGDDSILAVYLTAVEDENASEDDYVLNYTLNCASIDLAQDIAVTDAAHSQPLYAGAEVTTSFVCENLGLLSVSDVTASICDANGNLVKTTDGTGLADSIVWTVPDTYDGEVYTLKVVPADGNDADESNNIVSVDCAFTDLEAVDVNYVGEEGETTSLILSLKNNGLVTSHGVTAVVEDRMTDTVLAEIVLGDIAGGAETDHRISVERGEYTDLTVTVIPEGFDLASDNNRVYLLIDEEITIEALPEKEKVELTITECSTTLGGEIGVNFYMEIPGEAAADENARIRFTQITTDGREIITEIPAADAAQADGTFKFSCEVAAKEMADMITAKFVSDSFESKVHIYRVTDYVDTMLENASKYGAKAVDLAKAMIYYGGYAQSLFGYNTDALAYTEVGLNAEDSGVTSVTAEQFADFSHDTSKTVAGVAYIGSRLVLEAETSFQPYFRISADALETVKFLYNGAELKPVQDGSNYYISIDDIAAKDLDEVHVVTVQRGDASVEMTFVPLTYAKDVHAKMSDNTALVNLVNALYLYNSAADAYFEE